MGLRAKQSMPWPRAWPAKLSPPPQPSAPPEGELTPAASDPPAAAAKVSPAGTASPNPEDPLTPAIALREAGDYAAAHQWLEAWLAQQPHDVAAWALLAHVALLRKDEAQAEAALQRASALDAQHPAVLRNQARLLIKRQQAAPALTLAQQACTHEPSLENQLLLAAALGANGRDTEAAPLIERILQTKPDYAEAWANRALLLLRAKQPEAALQAAQKAVSLKPHLEQVWALIASLHAQQRHWREASEALRKSLEYAPEEVGRLSDLGEFLRRDKQLDEALRVLEQAVTAQPQNYAAWVNYGTALQEAERIDEAKAAYEKALALQPNSAEVANNLGALAKDREDWEEALRYFEQALTAKPDHVEIMSNKAAALNALERFEEAEALARAALDRQPDHPEAKLTFAKAMAGLSRYAEAESLLRPLAGLPDASSTPTTDLSPNLRSKVCHQLGTMYAELGRKEEAKALFMQAIELAPDDPTAYYGLADVYRFQRGDSYFERLERLYQRANKEAISRHEYLLYAMAAAYEHLGERERSFDLLLEASRRHRRMIRYDAEGEARFFQALEQAITREVYLRLQGHGYATNLPIFILGMPRSGTTLMEQILAAHPEVHGAGELKLFSRALGSGLRIGEMVLGSRPAIGAPAGQIPLAEEALAAIGERYVTALRALHPSARHITDKMPGNFPWLPLIALAMPGAKIIHMRRHPLDTCLSCLRTRFAEGQKWSYDLGELGRYYAGYWRLMAHWRQVCPEAFIDVDYERLIAEPEAETRRVLDDLGLPWDESCMRFHELERPVRTASRSQVRQPIYTSSQGKWRSLLPRLGALVEALGPEVCAAYDIPCTGERA